MREDFLHFLWRWRRFDAQNLATTDGQALEILHPGEPNPHAGPDFFNARIRLDGTLWAGNVEIHLNASDWLAHRHDHDPAYENVVLHVVLDEDQRLRRPNGEALPCFTLRRRIPPQLLEKYLRTEIEELHRNGVRLQSIGKTNALPKTAQKLLREGAELTKDNTGLTLTLALSYSGRWDIARAMQVMALDVRRGTLSPEDITEEKIASYLLTKGMPDPDLVIRTSGEMRLSNYLLWETAYSEIYITDSLWPDFRRTDLYKALLDYFGRERRFGKTSAQLLDSDAPRPERSYLQRLMNIFSAK